MQMEDRNRPVTGYPAPNPQSNGYNANPPPSAYPYVVAPPPNGYYNYPQSYPQQQYQYDPDSVRRAICLRRIFAFIVGVVVIFGTVSFIIWLVLRPELPEFRVDSVSVSNFSLGKNSLISFTSEIRLTARNPNKKMRLAYDHIDAMLFYKSDSLAETTVSPFSQSTKSETPLTANFAASGSYAGKDVVNGVNGEREKNGNLNFNLRMVSKIRFEAKSWKTRERFLKVFCGDLVVGLPSNGTAGPGKLSGGPVQCREGI